MGDSKQHQQRGQSEDLGATAHEPTGLLSVGAIESTDDFVSAQTKLGNFTAINLRYVESAEWDPSARKLFINMASGRSHVLVDDRATIMGKELVSRLELRVTDAFGPIRNGNLTGKRAQDEPGWRDRPPKMRGSAVQPSLRAAAKAGEEESSVHGDDLTGQS